MVVSREWLIGREGVRTDSCSPFCLVLVLGWPVEEGRGGGSSGAMECSCPEGLLEGEEEWKWKEIKKVWITHRPLPPLAPPSYNKIQCDSDQQMI